MEPIIIEAGEATPYISFDNETGRFEIAGSSYEEDVSEVYRPILSWLEEYKESSPKSAVLEIKLKYFNTSSSKYIHDLLMHLKDLEETGTNITVNWYYEQDDDVMREEIEEFAAFASISVNILEVELFD